MNFIPDPDLAAPLCHDLHSLHFVDGVRFGIIWRFGGRLLLPDQYLVSLLIIYVFLLSFSSLVLFFLSVLVSASFSLASTCSLSMLGLMMAGSLVLIFQFIINDAGVFPVEGWMVFL